VGTSTGTPSSRYSCETVLSPSLSVSRFPSVSIRPDNFALLVIGYLDLYDLVLVVRAVFVALSLCFILALTE
jgi:hypothetical protein